MASGYSRMRLVVSFAALVAFAVTPIAAQESDPDPNSPTPVILTVENTTSALAVTRNRLSRTNLRKVGPTAFPPGSTVALFVTNLVSVEEDGPTAFRVYAEDVKGHTYRFPVLGIQKSDFDGVYTLIVKLKDEMGF